MGNASTSEPVTYHHRVAGCVDAAVCIVAAEAPMLNLRRQQFVVKQTRLVSFRGDDETPVSRSLVLNVRSVRSVETPTSLRQGAACYLSALVATFECSVHTSTTSPHPGSPFSALLSLEAGLSAAASSFVSRAPALHPANRASAMPGMSASISALRTWCVG